jgi:zinc protease
MVVVVVGDVDRAAVERVTRQAFGNWPTAAVPAPKPGAPKLPARSVGPKLPPDEVACAKNAREVVPSFLMGSAVGIAYPAPSVREEPDTHAMDLILTLLENPEFGRITRLLKGQYEAEATYETRRQPGLFTIIVQTGKDDPEPIEALIRKEIDFLATHAVSPQELALAKSALRGSYALDNEPYSGQAGTLGYYAAIDSWQFATSYLDKMETVTPEQVLETARKFFNPERTVTVLQKPRGAPPARPNR